MLKILLCLFFIFQTANTVMFAQDAASLTVTIVDPKSAMMSDAEITLTNTDRGVVTRAKTEKLGFVIFDPLKPGNYTIEVVKAGFNTFRVEQLEINVRDRRVLRLEMLAAAAAATPGVVVERNQAPSTDSGLSMVFDRQFIDNLPANGRSAESLILLVPGITTSAGNKGGSGFNSSGVRSNANFVTVDGVSVNLPVGGVSGAISPGAGGATEIIPIDAMQEMRVQTAALAPEFGRSQGAQVAITSLAGTNSFHGSLYYYLRRDKYDANDWFANAGGFGKGKEHQNRPGLAFGGPAVKNRTFFFLSLEELKLTSPYSIFVTVPDLASRRSTTTALRPYLNAFPIPNDANLTNGGAVYRNVLSNPSRSDFASLRLDHILTSRMSLFVRYSLAPSSTDRRGFDGASPNVVTYQDTHSQSLTGGFTRTFASGTVNDLRVNYSNYSTRSNSIMDNFGGAIPLNDSVVFPKGVTSANGSFNLNILGYAGYNFGGRASNAQKQFDVADTISKVVGSHSFTAGVDLRRIMLTNERNPFSMSAAFDGVSGGTYSYLGGFALNSQIISSLGTVYPTLMNSSLYAQDTWRGTDRTTFTFGLRWDLNPAPFARSGPKPFGLSDSTIAGVTQNEPIYPTRWHDIAPRLGVAYLSDDTPGREMTFRAGAALFYGAGYGVTMGAFDGAPYASVRTISTVKFPLTTINLTPPALPPVRPYGLITAGNLGLTSPMIYQFSATWEKFFGAGQMISLGWVGTKGRELLRPEVQPSFTGAEGIARVVTNGGISDYNGFQLVYRRRFSGSLQTQVSYTLARSVDTVSSDVFFGGGFAKLIGSNERGSSDYDARHSVSISGSYRLPGPQKGIAGSVIGGWFLDFVATGRSALPFDIQGVSSNFSSATSNTSTTTVTDTTTGVFAQVRPNTTGKPIWIDDPTVAGGRRVSKDAFSIPTGFQQGNMIRNSLRGFLLYQADLSLRKNIRITERFHLSFAAQAYNLSNHTNFANPSPLAGANFSSPNFGVSTSLVNQGFGGGMNSLYRTGGPRSMELTIKLQF
jgi:hypothetical protein